MLCNIYFKCHYIIFFFCYFHPFLWLQLNPHTSNFFIFDQYVLIIKGFFYILVHQCWHLLHISLWILSLCIFGQIDLKYQKKNSIKSLIELIQSSKFNAYFILVFDLLILSFFFYQIDSKNFNYSLQSHS